MRKRFSEEKIIGILKVASRFLRTFGFQAVAVSVSVSLCFNKSMSM